MEIQLILRWHLVRIYSPKQLLAKSKESYIEISIHPLKSDKQYLSDFLSEIIKGNDNESFKDHFSWWNLSDENSLSGTVREKTIIKYLFDVNSIPKTLKLKRIPIRRNSIIMKERVLEEDMVFLQLCTNAESFKSVFSTCKSRKGILNIDTILTETNSMLIDFTQQARLMSSQIYKKVKEN